MTDLEIFRVYEPDECAPDGYPFMWRSLGDGSGKGIKDLVRDETGHRCIRCGHPYLKGAGEWSPCDGQCTHSGEMRWRRFGQAWGADDLRNVAGAEIALRWDEVEARWRILTVHHLQLGHDAKRDLRWWNLVPLCQRCHLTIQRKVQMARIWPWPHSDWFKPYAAGWYAWAYEGQYITRAEALRRQDELLAYELLPSSGTL